MARVRKSRLSWLELASDHIISLYTHNQTNNSVISLVNCHYYELIITFESTEIVLELNGSTVFFIM